MNLLRASENPGRDKSGTKDRFNSFNLRILAMSNIVSEKFLSAMFNKWRDLRFFRYLWNFNSVSVVD